MFKSHKKKRVRRYFQINVARTLSSNVCQKKIIIANWTKSDTEGTFSWLYSKGLRCVLLGIKKGVCNILLDEFMTNYVSNLNNLKYCHIFKVRLLFINLLTCPAPVWWVLYRHNFFSWIVWTISDRYGV